MITRIFGTILSIFIILQGLPAQKNDLNTNIQQNKIYIDFKNESEIFYPYNIAKGSTVYSLSKAFQVEENKIYKYNHIPVNAKIEVGQMLHVPLLKNQIQYRPPASNKCVVLLYKVKPKETLYHISKRKLNIDINQLKKINGLQSDDLREGGDLIVGWYILDKTNEIPAYQHSDIVQKTDTSNKVKTVSHYSGQSNEENLLEDKHKPEKISKKRIIGIWDKNTQAKKGLFVLSNLAKQGSKIELYFPMNRTSVIATVIGRIPPDTYSEEIDIFISPEVARTLGIFDSRFSVEMRYIENRSFTE